MLKLNKLFYLSTKDTFHAAILPTSEQKTFLKGCRDDIRDYLRPRIKEATVSVLGMQRPVEPQFRDQGSWQYKTCIQVAHKPPQEMDWDFGVYLPVTVWEENGPPHAMAKAYFTLVEGLLQGLCQEKNWKLIGGKGNCIRVQVSSWAHIDIPLYAAPLSEFDKISARVLAMLTESSGAFTLDSAELLTKGEMVGQTWDEMDAIMMATRSGEWRKSDPQEIKRWFEDRVLEQGFSGEQLIRICRYLKAWRDHQWKEGGGPSSLLLMICAVNGFAGIQGRDDLVLENVAAKLSEALLDNVYCPAMNDANEDFNRLNQAGRLEASRLALTLSQNVLAARKQNNWSQDKALQFIIGLFGTRIPNDINLIELDASPADVRTTPSTKVAPPIVPSTKAG